MPQTPPIPAPPPDLVHLLLEVLHLALAALDDALDVVDARAEVGQLALQLGFLLRGNGVFFGGVRRRLPQIPFFHPKIQSGGAASMADRPGCRGFDGGGRLMDGRCAWGVGWAQRGGVRTPNGGIWTQNGRILTENGSIWTQNGGIWPQNGGILTKNGGILTKNGSIWIQNGGT